MGLRIVDGEVIVDHAESDHLNTGIIGNPTQLQLRGLAIHCVFQRKHNSAKAARDRDTKVLGDNCPLIYALKGKDGLTVSRSSIKALNSNIPTLLDIIAGKIAGDVDVILPMPSSSDLANILARRLAKRGGLDFRSDVLVKASNLAASARAKSLTTPGNRTLSYKTANRLKAAIRALHASHSAPYSAKDVRTDLRQYFDPLRLAPNAPKFPAGTRLLLVDDLLATGETLMAAQNVIVATGLAAASNAVTWFGPVRELS